MDFQKDYFKKYYGDYFRQNPLYKMITYLNLLSKHSKQGILLDIGCAYGLFLKVASDHFNCIGMDVDFDVLSEAAKRITRASLVCSALPRIPFKSIDNITLFDVVEHVEDLEAAFGELHGALRQGGIMLVVVPVYDGPLGWLVKKLDADLTHVHQQSRRFWLDLTQKYFKLLEYKGVFRRLLFGRFYLHLTTSLLRKISPAIIMVLRKE
jgi:SAM-dependent methyltransferase